ncbi:MAG: hypothetical protein WDZ45_05915 [Flavobacteriaceae bacterium]
MKTLHIEIKNAKAYKLLKNLEDLELIKVLKKKKATTDLLSVKYANSLPDSIIDDLHNQVAEARDSWERRTT